MLAKRIGVNLPRRAAIATAMARASCLVVLRRLVVDVIQAGGMAKTCEGGERRIESRAVSGAVARRWYSWASKVSVFHSLLVGELRVRGREGHFQEK